MNWHLTVCKTVEHSSIHNYEIIAKQAPYRVNPPDLKFHSVFNKQHTVPVINVFLSLLGKYYVEILEIISVQQITHKMVWQTRN